MAAHRNRHIYYAEGFGYDTVTLRKIYNQGTAANSTTMDTTTIPGRNFVRIPAGLYLDVNLSRFDGYPYTNSFNNNNWAWVIQAKIYIDAASYTNVTADRFLFEAMSADGGFANIGLSPNTSTNQDNWYIKFDSNTDQAINVNAGGTPAIPMRTVKDIKFIIRVFDGNEVQAWAYVDDNLVARTDIRYDQANGINDNFKGFRIWGLANQTGDTLWGDLIAYHVYYINSETFGTGNTIVTGGSVLNKNVRVYDMTPGFTAGGITDFATVGAADPITALSSLDDTSYVTSTNFGQVFRLKPGLPYEYTGDNSTAITITDSSNVHGFNYMTWTKDLNLSSAEYFPGMSDSDGTYRYRYYKLYLSTHDSATAGTSTLNRIGFYDNNGNPLVLPGGITMRLDRAGGASAASTYGGQNNTIIHTALLNNISSANWLNTYTTIFNFTGQDIRDDRVIAEYIIDCGAGNIGPDWEFFGIGQSQGNSSRLISAALFGSADGVNWRLLSDNYDTFSASGSDTLDFLVNSRHPNYSAVITNAATKKLIPYRTSPALGFTRQHIAQPGDPLAAAHYAMTVPSKTPVPFGQFKNYRFGLETAEDIIVDPGEFVPDVLGNLLVSLDAINSSSYSGTGITWYDISGYNNNATLVNSPVYDTSGYISFSGSNYVTLPPNIFPYPSTTTWTINLWFRSGQTTGGTILGQQNSTTPDSATGWVPVLYLRTDGTLRFEPMWTGSVNNFASSLNSLNDNRWHGLTVVYNSGTASLYVDGVLNGQLSGLGLVANGNPLYFILGAGYAASRGLTTNYFIGDIANFAFYNKVLTGSEITELYGDIRANYPLLTVTDDLLLYLDAANVTSYSGSGTSWNDLSSDDNDAILSRAGIYDNGVMVYNGTSDFVDVADFDLGTQFTFAAWIRTTQTSTSMIMARGNTANNRGVYLAHIDTYTGYLSAGGNSSGTWNWAKIHNTVINDGVWHFVAATYNQSTNTVTGYVDGVRGTTATVNFDANGYTPKNMKLSRNQVGNIQYFNGSANDYLVYNRALSDAEITQLYDETKFDYATTLTGLVMELDAASTTSYPGSGTTWYDISGNNNHATLINSPVHVYGNSGYFILNGTNQYITAPSAALPTGTNNFTMSLWVNLDSMSGRFFGDLVGVPNGGAGRGAVLLSGNAMGTLELIATNSVAYDPPNNIGLGYYGNTTTGSLNYAASPAMALNGWYNITLVRDGTNSQKLYLNGSLVATGNVSNSFNSGTLHIGGAPNFANYSGYVNGEISSVKVWNRALTPADVVANYNEDQHNRANLALYLDSTNYNSYPGSGTTWYDIGGYEKNATLVNGPTYGGNTRSLIFDGSNDYATIGALDGTFSSWTVMVYFYPNVVQSYNNVMDCNYIYYGSTGNIGPRLEMNNAGNLGWVWSTSTNNDVFWSQGVVSSGLQANQWHFAALSYDSISNTSKTYYNGALTAFGRGQSGTPTGALNFFSNINLGRGWFGRHFNGRIAAVKIYRQALNDGEVAQAYDSMSKSVLVTDGLVLNLDASITTSYPGSGTTWTDLSGLGHNGTMVNGTAYNSTNGGGLVFDGVDDYVTVSETAALQPQILTLDMTFKVNSATNTRYGTANANYQYLAFRQNNRTGQFEGYAIIYDDSTGKILAATATDSGVQSTLVSTTTFPIGSICHITVVFDNTLTKIYKNGVYDSQLVKSSGIYYRSTHTLKLGRTVPVSSTWDAALNGNIYACRIYNRALSDSEITQNFNAIRGRFGL